MADNTQLNPGTGGDTIATDDVGGIKHQLVKLEYGPDGAATRVDTGTPLPVTNSSLPLPAGASTAAKQDTGNTSLASVDTKTPALGQALAAGSTPVVLTAAQITTLTPLSSVSVSNFPATQPVSGTIAVSNFPATQPVSGTVTANAGTNLNTSALALEAGHLATIDSHIPAQGQALAAASTPVVLTAIQQTALTPPAAITGFALEAGHLATIDTSTAKIPAQGQALAAASMPVVLPATQITTLTPPAAITGFALEAGHIATIDSHTPALGQALAAASVPVVLTAVQITTLTPLATVAVTSAGLTNLDVALSTRLKPADTLAAVTAVTAITNALPAGTNLLGKVGIDQTTPGTTNNVSVTPPTLTKGTQAATGFSIQDLKDAGRNTRIFMLDAITAAPLVEALATVVQWYGNAAVAGTTTPAVVPAGKTLRLTGYKIMYQSLATVGYAVVRVRFNTAGVAVLASPLVASFEAGSGSGATTAAMTGGVTTETGSFPEGLELPAAGGIGFSVAGYGPTGTLTLEGGVRFEVHGYEY